MKNLSKLLCIALLIFGINSASAKNSNKEKLNAKEVYAKYVGAVEFNETAFNEDLNTLNLIQKKALVVMALRDYKSLKGSDNATVIEYILAVFLPPVAVGLHTDWDLKPTLSNVGWTILGGIPGIIHAFVVLGRD